MRMVGVTRVEGEGVREGKESGRSLKNGPLRPRLKRFRLVGDVEDGVAVEDSGRARGRLVRRELVCPSQGPGLRLDLKNKRSKIYKPN